MFTSKLTLATISPVADTLRYPPTLKITFQKSSFLKTLRIIALTDTKSKRKVGSGAIRRSRGDRPTVYGGARREGRSLLRPCCSAIRRLPA